MAKTIYDLSGNTIKATGFEDEAGNALGDVSDKAQVVALTNASANHTVNATFSNTEVKAALDALGTKINQIIAALKA